MCGGGGGGYNAADPTYQQNIQRDKDNAAANAARDQANEAQQAIDNATAANTAAANTARGNAPNLVRQYFADRGVNADDSTIQRIADSISSTVPANDPNPAQYYSNDAIAGQVSGIEQTNRQGYNAQVGKVFAPGFETQLIPDNAADPIVSSILGSQYATAKQGLDFNKARGVLNDTGYNTSLDTLGTQNSAAQSTLRGIANSVIGKDRQDLTNIRGDAGNAASAYSFGSAAPDIGSYYGRAQSKAASDLSDIEGSVRSAVGGTNYFDVPTALQKGGTLQGPINLTTAASAPGAAPNKTQGNRVLNSSGVF